MAKQYDENEVMKMLGEPENQRRAFGIIVQQYTETLYWKIRRIVLDHDDANDVLQNTFLKAWNSIGDFQSKSKVSTWLYRIAINESLDHLRKQQHKISTDMDLSVANRLMADDYFDGDDAQALLQEAIAALPDVQRTVFTLRYYDEMKYSELSKLTGTSEGALKASYHIAVKKISEYVLNHSANTTSNKKTI
ncbi:MAG: RNA polymerase sigma factor [Prevotella sp.]|jgi:RNA polymerase sigma-70 factor (ECF subfamily)|nr:RNA polymerase sigma factor [Prevotella sp.]